MEDRILKAVNTSSGKGFPQAPLPASPGNNPPDPEDRNTSPQSINLAQAADKNFVKLVQNESTGNQNYVINHGRLHANGYRLLKEGKEVRSRVISKAKENLYTLEADPKLIGSAPETVKDDFAADPSNPQNQPQLPAKTAKDEASAYIADLVDQGLLGEHVDQETVENYAKALIGDLPLQSDGTDPNKVSIDMLRQKIEENSGSEVASALFNVDPDDPAHVNLDSFIQQIRQKRSIEKQNESPKEKKDRQKDEQSIQESTEKMARMVLSAGFFAHDIGKPANFRQNKSRLVDSFGLQYYESMGYGFVNSMLGVQLKHLNVPVNNVEDFFMAVSAKDSSGNFIHFEFIKNTYMKLGYSAANSARKAEYYLQLLSNPLMPSFGYLQASGLSTHIQRAINCYNASDKNISADDLYRIDISASVAQDDDKPEDVKDLEKEKVLNLKSALRKEYLTDEEMEYGILHILQKPIGAKALTLDMDRFENLETHLSKKIILALKNDGQLAAFFERLKKLDVYSVDELLGKFDIQPEALKLIDPYIEEAKETLFDIAKEAPTGVKVDPGKAAEYLYKISLAKLRIQILQDLKSMGMKPNTFDKNQVKELIANRRQGSLESKLKGLLDWANGDIDPEKDYPLVTDSGIAERQQQLAVMFTRPEDVKNASYAKLKELHKQQAAVGGTPTRDPKELGKSTPTAKDDELDPAIANSVESAIQGRDLSILKVSKDLIYEINNSFIEMSNLEKGSLELVNKRDILEKFLNSRGISPSGAKSVADAVLNVVKGGVTGSSGGSPTSAKPEKDETAVPATVPDNADQSIEGILARLEGKNIRKVPKAVQKDIEKLKTYLEVNNADLTDKELQELFKYYNPPAPQFSFEEYAKANPQLFKVKGNQVFVKVGDTEVPVPENIKSSQENIERFIQQQEAAIQERKAQILEAERANLIAAIEKIDNIGKLKRQDKEKLLAKLIESGMNKAEATELLDQLIAAKRPVLEAKVQAKRKGLANSSKVKNIFTSDGESLTADEIMANRQGLEAAVFAEISDYFFSDEEAKGVAEQIVLQKYNEATQAKRLKEAEAKLGFEEGSNGKTSSTGELTLEINGQPVAVTVKKTNKGYEFIAGKDAKVVLPQDQVISKDGTIDFDVIVAELSSSVPAQQTEQINEKSKKENTTTADTAGIKPEVTSGKLTNAKDVASSIVGAIISGKPVRLAAPLTSLNEDSWFALVDGIAKSKAFKKLKLPPEAAEDIVFQITSAPENQLEFDFSNMIKATASKSIFSVLNNLVTKTVDFTSNQYTPSDFATTLVIGNYIDSLQQAEMLSEDSKAQIEMLVNNLLDEQKLTESSAKELLDKINLVV